jgi:hypothetical protein
MSSTRHAPQGAPISYHRYMSSPEFVEMRGIPGTVVAAKAQLCLSARTRSLLFFLQLLSFQEGGLRRVARTLSKRLDRYDEDELANLLIEVCINPKFVIETSNKESARSSLIRSHLEIGDALLDYQDRYEAGIKSNFVLTTIGAEVFETLDHALAIGKMVVIEGEPGNGKTTATEAWCAQHQGQVRFISLSGISHKTGFFRKLATAVGLSSANRKSIDMQLKVEEFFRKTGLMLVIDEAHYLFPQHQRSNCNPELVDWVNTALVNHHVPVALICTDQFAKLKARVEKRTGWTSEQFEHRVSRYKKLPTTPTKQDLEAVAAKLLRMRWNSVQQQWETGGPAPPHDFIKMIVGYALTCKMRLPAVSDTIQEARYQACKNGRSQIVATDIRTALLDYRIPSDEALQQAFEPAARRSTSREETPPYTRNLSMNSVVQRRCTTVA